MIPLEAPVTVQRYLSRATCLLIGSTRNRIQTELYANLYQQMLTNQWQEPEAVAWQGALEQAGPSWQLALGFARVYTLPLIGRSLLVSAALGSAAYAIQGQAQLHQPALQKGHQP